MDNKRPDYKIEVVGETKATTEKRIESFRKRNLDVSKSSERVAYEMLKNHRMKETIH